MKDAPRARDGFHENGQQQLEVKRRLPVTLGDAAPATGSFKVTHGSHILPSLSQDDSEQLKKMVRGDAQLALAHVSFYDAHDAAGLTLDEAHQVPASKVAGHE
jgi:hypothetical protein